MIAATSAGLTTGQFIACIVVGAIGLVSVVMLGVGLCLAARRGDAQWEAAARHPKARRCEPEGRAHRLRYDMDPAPVRRGDL